MTRSSPPRRWLRRLAAVLGATPVVLVLLVLGVYALACHTAMGRDAVRKIALAEVALLIPGQLEVDALPRLGLTGVELRGVRVQDPTGARVLSIDVVSVSLAPLPLLEREVRVERVLLRGVELDLADLGAKRGLLAAVTPSGPSIPEAPDVGPATPLPIHVEAIALEDVSVALELAGFGRLGVHGLQAAGRFEQNGVLRAELASLACALTRDGAPLASIERVHASYASEGAPSTLELSGRLGEASLSLSAEAHLPDDAAFETEPLSLALELDALDAATLTALGQPDLAARLLQPVRVHVDVGGTGGSPHAEVALAAAAGSVTATASLSSGRRLDLELEVVELALAELLADVPAARASVSLGGTAELAQGPEAMPVTLELRQGSWDGWRLPRVSARAQVSPSRVQALVLEAHGYGGELSLEADAELAGRARGTLRVSLPTLAGFPERLRRQVELDRDGSLSLRTRFAIDGERVEAHASVQARALALPLMSSSASVDRFDAELTARGHPKAPEVEGTARGTALAFGGLKLASVDVTVGGGPARYRATLATSLPGGKVEAAVDWTRASNAVGVELNAPRMDLAALGRGLGLAPALRGHASVSARAHGRLEAPVAEIALRGKGVGLAGRPGIDVVLDGALDTPEARASLKGRIDSGAALALELRADAELPRGRRTSWSRRVEGARIDASLQLARLGSDFIEAWLPEPLPFHAEVAGRVQLTGSVAEPALESELEVQLRELAGGEAVGVRVKSRYAAGEAGLELAARDAVGSWIEARAQLAHPGRSTQAFIAAAPGLLNDGAFELELQAAPRRLAALPLAPVLPPALGRIELGAHVSATHAPAQEPSVELTLSALSPPAARAAEGCDARGQAEVLLRLEGGRLDGRLTLSRDDAQLLELLADARVELRDALALRGSPVVEALSAHAALKAVELAELPVLCDRMRGRLSGTLEGGGLLSDVPRLTLSLRGERLSLGGPRRLEARIDATLQEPEARVDVELRHGKGRSTLAARVPLRVRDRALEVPRDAPLSAHLDLGGLPLAALVPPEGPISRVRGTVGGRVDVGGSLDEPDVRGRLEPRGVGFTATALAQPLSDIEGSLVFDSKRASIERLTARDGKGTLELSGQGTLGEAGALTAKLKLAAEDFPLRQQGRIAGELDAKVGIDVAVGDDGSRVALRLEDVAVWLFGGDMRKGIDLDPHPDIIDPRAPRLPESPVSDADAKPLRLSIDASDSFWVRRDDFAVKLSTELVVEVDGDATHVEGPVLLHRGYLQLLGTTFDLSSDSRLDFIGSEAPDPVLAIVADTENRRSGKRITVQIGGRASAPELVFLVDDDAATAGEAAIAILGGGDDSGDAASGQARSFVAGVVAGVMAVSARRELGDAMPILLLDPPSDEEGARVRAGFELDSLVPSVLEGIVRGVYVEGICASGSEEQKSGMQGGVLLELYLPHDLVTSGQYGPGETWSVDLGWEP